MALLCHPCITTANLSYRCPIFEISATALYDSSWYYKACTKYVPVLLSTTKLAQSTSHYYFVLQSLHKARPSTTLYYKACTKHVPVLLSTTKLAQSTSHYYFILQSLHKAHPSTTLYFKACKKDEKLQLQNRISMPKQKNDDFEALFKRNFKRKIIIAKIDKICCQNTIPISYAAITMRLTTFSWKTQ